jgi:anti-sigma regulatory factor (Ser/Thr protein kinase)
MLPTIILVADSSDVPLARRAGDRLAQQLQWDEELSGRLSIVLSETASNLAKHAKRGEIHLRICNSDGEKGIEVLAVDRGPGVARIESCLADGYSTVGTAGTGLGAISRLSGQFDIYSQEGKGTCLVARLFAAARSGLPERERHRLSFGSMQVPFPGETVCGDNWAVSVIDGQTAVLMADGLGHGPGAAEASGEAVATFQRAKVLDPAVILEQVHYALRSTRGAAVAVAQINPAKEQVRFAGTGNISGRLLSGVNQQNMVSHSGTAGHNVKIQEFRYVWSPKTCLVMHSDGINTSWRPDAYPGIVPRDPSLLAAVLLRDASRGRDDACVLVGRE